MRLTVRAECEFSVWDLLSNLSFSPQSQHEIFQKICMMDPNEGRHQDASCDNFRRDHAIIMHLYCKIWP